MTKLHKLLWGSDPEEFAIYMDAEGNPCAYPPYKFRHNFGVFAEVEPEDIEGKHPVFLKGDGFKIHEDGAAFEFSVRPSHNPREVFDMIQFCKNLTSQEILKKFPEHCLPALQSLPTVKFDVERWLKEIEDGLIDEEGFNMSTRFGCDPDNDAFNTKALQQVLDVKVHPWRYAGGHIHISGFKDILKDYIHVVTCLALTAGMAGVAFSDVSSLEHDRTFWYGKPGKYRIQNYGPNNSFGKDYQYGIEYRTLSTRWSSSWDIASQVFKWAEIGIKNLYDSTLGTELAKKYTDLACKTILSADKETATQFLAYVETRL